MDVYTAFTRKLILERNLLDRDALSQVQSTRRATVSSVICLLHQLKIDEYIQVAVVLLERHFRTRSSPAEEFVVKFKISHPS